MRISIFASILLLTLILSTNAAAAPCLNGMDHDYRRLASQAEENLCHTYGGQVILVVNTASRCGFTGQFADLETLYQKYRDDGLVILGFPSDDFRQEHSDEADTAEVCYINYGVTFPMFATTSVRGDDSNPLFATLGQLESPPRWNFTKYLIDSNGELVGRFGSRTSPLDSPLEAAVIEALDR